MSTIRSILQLFQKDLSHSCLIYCIDEDQTGFIKGRQAQDNIRKIIHIVEEVQRRGNSVVLVSLDAEINKNLASMGILSNAYGHCITSQQQE